MSRARPTVREVLVSGAPGDDETQNRLLRNLRLPNGTKKTTWPRRMDDVHQAITQQVAGRGRVRLLDVAVSSGVSTVELIDALTTDGVDVDAVATDLLVTGHLERALPGFHVFRDGQGQPIQFDLAGVGIRNTSAGATDAVGRGVPAGLCRATAAVAARVRRPVPVATVDLLVSTLRDVARVEEEDLTRPRSDLDGPFDVVRAANILNNAYFSPPVLRTMTERLWRRVADDGLLVVVRTQDDGHNHGAIFHRLPDGSAEVVHRFDGPCDIELLDDPGIDIAPGQTPETTP